MNKNKLVLLCALFLGVVSQMNIETAPTKKSTRVPVKQTAQGTRAYNLPYRRTQQPAAAQQGAGRPICIGGSCFTEQPAPAQVPAPAPAPQPAQPSSTDIDEEDEDIENMDSDIDEQDEDVQDMDSDIDEQNEDVEYEGN